VLDIVLDSVEESGIDYKIQHLKITPIKLGRSVRRAIRVLAIGGISAILWPTIFFLLQYGRAWRIFLAKVRKFFFRFETIKRGNNF